MQTASSIVWTRVALSVTNIGNRYTMNTCDFVSNLALIFD